MTEKTLTTENIKPALDALRGELAPWPVVAKKQDRLNTAQLNAANSGITSSLVAQIIANTAAIRALESAITGTGLRALVVSSLPAVGTTGILYIVPVTTYDPDTDADVVNYSNEYIWIPVEGGTASEGHYEQVGQTGIVINNGQLTITVNGTSVGTFTANQSGDTTAAITVPTNADYVDRTTDQTVAGVKTFSSTINGTASKAIADEDGTSIKTGYGKLAGSQTWTGENTTTSNFNIQKSSPVLRIRNTDVVIASDGQQSLSESKVSTLAFKSSNDTFANAELINYANASFNRFRFVSRWYTSNSALAGNGVGFDLYTDSTTKGILPTENSRFTLGSSSYQWSSVYAQSYYYNGTAWGLDKYNIWTNSQVYKLTGTEVGSTTSGYISLSFIDKNNNNLGFQRASVYSDGRTCMSWKIYNTDSNSQSISSSLEYYISKAGVKVFAPTENATIDLGTSTNKWKTLNGINPGALSLPDASNAVALDTTNVSMDGTYTYLSVSVNGWLYFALKDTSIKTDGELTFYIGDSGTSSAYAKWAVNFVCSTDGYVRCFIPVLANSRIRVRINPNGGSPTNLTMTIYPCLGNV